VQVQKAIDKHIFDHHFTTPIGKSGIEWGMTTVGDCLPPVSSFTLWATYASRLLIVMVPIAKQVGLALQAFYKGFSECTIAPVRMFQRKLLAGRRSKYHCPTLYIS